MAIEIRISNVLTSEDAWLFLIIQDMYKSPRIYHFQGYHSLSELPLIVVPLCPCQLCCLTLGPLQALRDTWSPEQELALVLWHWSIQAGGKENVEGFCKDPHPSDSAGFWDSFCSHFVWVWFFNFEFTKYKAWPSALSTVHAGGFYRTVMGTSQ